MLNGCLEIKTVILFVLLVVKVVGGNCDTFNDLPTLSTIQMADDVKYLSLQVPSLKKTTICPS